MIILTKQNDKINEIIKEMYNEIFKDYKKISDSKEFELEFDYYLKDRVRIYISKLSNRTGFLTDSGMFSTKSKYDHFAYTEVGMELLNSFDKLGIEKIDYEVFRKVFAYVMCLHREYQDSSREDIVDALLYEGNKLERLEYYKKFVNICTMFYLTTKELKLANIDDVDSNSGYKLRNLFGTYIPSCLGDFIKPDVDIEENKTVTFTIDTIKGDFVFILSFQSKKEDSRIMSILLKMIFKQKELVEKSITNTLIGFDTNVRDFLLNDNKRALIIKYSKKKHGIEITFNHSNGVFYHFISSNLIKAYSEKENTYPGDLPLTVVEIKGEDNIELPCTVYELALAD
jgi:hypothetical protein